MHRFKQCTVYKITLWKGGKTSNIGPNNFEVVSQLGYFGSLVNLENKTSEGKKYC